MNPAEQKTNLQPKLGAKIRKKIILEMVTIFILCVVVFLLAGVFDILEIIVEFSWRHEDWELDELITTSFFFSFAISIFAVRRLLEYRRALLEVKKLQGMLPICSACKKIRDDAGSWHQIESYVRDHSETEFSHSVCPDCIKKVYPNYVKKEKKTGPADPQ